MHTTKLFKHSLNTTHRTQHITPNTPYTPQTAHNTLLWILITHQTHLVMWSLQYTGPDVTTTVHRAWCDYYFVHWSTDVCLISLPQGINGANQYWHWPMKASHWTLHTAHWTLNMAQRQTLQCTVHCTQHTLYCTRNTLSCDRHIDYQMFVLFLSLMKSMYPFRETWKYISKRHGVAANRYLQG